MTKTERKLFQELARAREMLVYSNNKWEFGAARQARRKLRSLMSQYRKLYGTIPQVTEEWPGAGNYFTAGYSPGDVLVLEETKTRWTVNSVTDDPETPRSLPITLPSRNAAMKFAAELIKEGLE